jgi:hypothetical protein
MENTLLKSTIFISETMDVDELRRQQFAIRSFTESVDDGADWPPAPPPLPVGSEDNLNLAIDEGEDGAGGDGGGMKESSTADTIIEMVRTNKGYVELEEWSKCVEIAGQPKRGPHKRGDAEVHNAGARARGKFFELKQSNGFTYFQLVDQEFELHKSLIKEGVAGGDNELELEGAAEFEAMAKGGDGRDGGEQQKYPLFLSLSLIY